MEDGKVWNKPHLAILVDNHELDVILMAIAALRKPESDSMYDRLSKLQGSIPGPEPLGVH